MDWKMGWTIVIIHLVGCTRGTLFRKSHLYPRVEVLRWRKVLWGMRPGLTLGCRRTHSHRVCCPKSVSRSASLSKKTWSFTEVQRLRPFFQANSCKTFQLWTKSENNIFKWVARRHRANDCATISIDLVFSFSPFSSADVLSSDSNLGMVQTDPRFKEICFWNMWKGHFTTCFIVFAGETTSTGWWF